jgi:hypothetical protein
MPKVTSFGRLKGVVHSLPQATPATPVLMGAMATILALRRVAAVLVAIEEPLQHFQAKWIPVRRQEIRSNKEKLSET